jgi:arylsulfatase A-like enzyme
VYKYADSVDDGRNWLSFGILDPKARTSGHYLADAGYNTCIAGKWQLQSYDPPDYPGSRKRRGTGMRVEDAGFDEYSLWHTAHTEDKGSRYANPVILENGAFRTDLEGRYGPDIWVDYINDYMRRKNDDPEPFFVYYSMALPHWPMVPTPDSSVWTDPSRRLEERDGYFKDMVEYMDKCVGRIVDQVDSLGIAAETLVMFFSDNGTHLRMTTKTNDGPVTGGKGMTTDAGTHVPMMVRWKGTIEPGVDNHLVDSTDFLPTLMSLAERPIGKDEQLDGRSFHARLMGDSRPTRDWIFCHFDPRPGWDKDRFRKVRFARDRRFKLYDDGRLLDVPQDRLEQQPLPDSNDTRVVRARLQSVLDQMPNPDNAPRD